MFKRQPLANLLHGDILMMPLLQRPAHLPPHPLQPLLLLLLLRQAHPHLLPALRVLRPVLRAQRQPPKYECN